MPRAKYQVKSQAKPQSRLPAKSRARSAEFRAVARTVGVIRALNELGVSRVTDLARATRIPRPSLYRIIETLCALGYMQRREGQELYELTVLVRTLSEGFNDEPWVCNAAQPVMEALQREIVWPTDISTFFGNAMYLRGTTRRHSPLTIDTATAGLRLPMLQSASGRAYLAFCSDAERAAIIANLKRSTEPCDKSARDAGLVRNLVAATRKKGYGERHGEVFAKTGAIAIPVRQGDRVLACLSISFIASALTPREAAARYLPQLRGAGRDIEARLSAEAGNRPPAVAFAAASGINPT
jgi:IclR family mhp operon transcriptional activator